MEYNTSGTDIIADEDWDNLILLDACRYDAYTATTPFVGPIEMRESRGSTSRQFVRGNFNGKRLHDTVVISGNRWYLDLQNSDDFDCEFHAYYDVERDAADGFVPSAEAVTEAALDKIGQYPNKRLVIHYMQPHHPYIGTDIDGFEQKRVDMREYVRRSSVDTDTIRAAYQDNLQYVLKHVQRLVEELEGKTVISADHGEALGERLSPFPVSWFGHPIRVYTDELVQVPWHVVSNESRRTIRSESPRSQLTDIDQAEIEQSLKDLGYK
ncbi:hypothetical protein HISP_18995 (plasmid) [Haloarcula hispanica N601]|uniref:Sulfatase N-terminal domain-containing protein n=2 Tax=Haloarcula hispanica TaxID=51589 RepID=V5TSX6_HALHI|nr:conserved hypothetical protein [Haloarcula hispanica ATCC 33960]AHB68351.2 hypothetical protein HISP_18995 [Haloarcula hispanica N601]